MSRCEVCGNEYEDAFEVVAAGSRSLECAIQMMAPVCEPCGSNVIGRGVEGEWPVLLLRPLAPETPSHL